MRSIVAIVVVILSGTASAQELRHKPSDVGATIDRGLAFLAKDALAWKNEHNCVSCHHAGLVIWSMREAKQRGHAVDEPVLAEMTKWVAESGDGKFGLARPASAPKALNPKAVWFALALGADPEPDAVSRKGHETPAEDGERRPDRERVVVRVARNPAADLRQFR